MGRNWKKKDNSKKGITLVALVITIIILLILAGITINLTVGQRGILNRAQEAGRNYQEAAKKEDEDLTKFLEEADNIIAGGNSPTNEKYTMVEGVPVPKGFEHLEGTKETGFVIKDTSVDSKGNPTKTNGNEYVWVPCSEDGTNGIKYNRYTFGSMSNSNYLEAMPSEELDSIREYGGFYIGRYEVGIVGYDSNVVTSNSNNLASWTGYTGGTAVVQKGKQVWNYITRDKAKEIAEGMYDNNDAVISKLCSSYAWDTTLKFIETKYPTYPTNSIQGNFVGTAFEYVDLNGDTQAKVNGGVVLVPTGQTTAVNNIYDMGGNAWEWTTEGARGAIYPFVARGGSFGNDSSRFPAGSRSDSTTGPRNDTVSFRQTLYIVL